jgi:hypothetical protein
MEFWLNLQQLFCSIMGAPKQLANPPCANLLITLRKNLGGVKNDCDEFVSAFTGDELEITIGLCAGMGGATRLEVIRRPLKTNKFEFRRNVMNSLFIQRC